MTQTQLAWFLKQYGAMIVYGLVCINIFGMIIAIKSKINDDLIVTSIDKVETEIVDTTQEKYYLENFYIPYLWSEYAQYFIAHESNRIFEGEYIIKLYNKQPKQWSTDEQSEEQSEIIDRQQQTPSQAWQRFLLEKMRSIN